MSQKISHETPLTRSTDSSGPSAHSNAQSESQRPQEPHSETQDGSSPTMEEVMGQYGDASLETLESGSAPTPEGRQRPPSSAQPRRATSTPKSKGQDQSSSENSFDSNSRLPQVGSMTLARIPESRRPDPPTVCEHCPASMWLVSGMEVKNYCRIMHVYSWTSKEPVALSDCDGIAIASASAAAER